MRPMWEILKAWFHVALPSLQSAFSEDSGVRAYLFYFRIREGDMKAGTYLDTPVKEYRAWPAISYSSLSRFNESQDHALMDWPAKSYFEEGTAFELLIEDKAKGTAKFKERFFLANAPGNMPEGLAQWIEDKEDLDDKYIYNKPDKKTGEIRLNKRHERTHLWLDSCRQNPGKMPMGKDQIEMLNKMVDNFFLMQPLIDMGSENTLAEILPHADFQVPIFWYVGKMKKKALIDCLFVTDPKVYVFDIKTAADLGRYQWALKSYGWIQECHYTAGLQSIFKDKEIVWRFLVSSKAEPYISQPFQVDPYSMAEYGMQEYYDLCEKYQAWVDDGRKPKGWKELESVKVFFN